MSTNKKAQISIEFLFFILIFLIIIYLYINSNLNLAENLKENKLDKYYNNKLEAIYKEYINKKNIISKEEKYEKEGTDLYI